MSAMVFGASGFIGRWLLRELVSRQQSVIAAVRSESSQSNTVQWLESHGVSLERVTFMRVDLETDGLGLFADPSGKVLAAEVRDLFNVAGAYTFGMSEQEAYEANVATSLRIVDFAATLPHLRRLVHLSGYRVGNQNPDPAPWSAEQRTREYVRLGAYEASKMESDAAVQHAARRLGVPCTIANPPTVIGDSVTGESDQYLGLATIIRDLIDGHLPALPSGADTFLPIVTADYLARVMVSLPEVEETAGQSYWILDNDTPTLHALIRIVAAHVGIKAPRLTISTTALRRLPRAITKAEPETLSFLSGDRYPHEPAQEFARSQGIVMPDVTTSLLRWVDYLDAHHFGRGARNTLPARIHAVADVRTHEVGRQDASAVVLPGIPMAADTWSGVLERLERPARAVTLPGLGGSGGDLKSWKDWTDEFFATGGPYELIGHSVGAGVAVELAASAPERVESLTLIAPAFLQRRVGRIGTWRPFVTAVLRHSNAMRLSSLLTGQQDAAHQLETTRLNLRKPARAARAAEAFAYANQSDYRDTLRRKFEQLTIPVNIIVGSEDPLSTEAEAWLRGRNAIRVHTLPGAGHHPQLTHPEELASALAEIELERRGSAQSR